MRVLERGLVGKPLARLDVGAGHGPFAEQALSPPWLLEGDFGRHEVDVAADEAMSCLRFLARARARIEHDIGRGLLLFGRGRRFDPGTLGHSHFDDFIMNRLGFSGALGRELRSLAESLERLPRLREAFLTATLSRSKVRAVLRVATPEDEAAWGQLARRMGTRELEQLVEDVRAGRRAAPVEDVAAAQAGDCAAAQAEEMEIPVTWRASAVDRALWQRHGLTMLRTIVGIKGPVSQLAEALAADTLVTLEGGPPAPEDRSCFVRARLHVAAARSRAATRPRRQAGRAPSPHAAVRLARRFVRALGKARLDQRGPRPADFDACADAWDALGELERLCRERSALDCERAFLLATCHRRSLHLVLGFRSLDAFVEQGLGLAPRDAFAALEVTRRLLHLPAITRAWREGRISQRDAEQLAEVADDATEDEWLRYADGATRKLLGEAVSWAAAEEARRLSTNEPGAVLPPWHLLPRELTADWMGQLASREQRRRHRERMAAVGVEVRAELGPEDDPMLDVTAAACGLGSHLVRGRTGFSAPAGVAAMWWAAVEAVRQRVDSSLTDAGCVRVMLEMFAQSHLTPEAEKHLRAHRALLRDGYRCTTPGCTAVANFHEHHVRFRSRGGSDDLWNLDSKCLGCHGLVHDGAISAEGEAPDDITWTIGPAPGRELWRNERRVRAAEARV